MLNALFLQRKNRERRVKQRNIVPAEKSAIGNEYISATQPINGQISIKTERYASACIESTVARISDEISVFT